MKTHVPATPSWLRSWTGSLGRCLTPARRPHPSDRRSYRIHLTAAGIRTHQQAVTLFGPVRSQVIESLHDEDGRVQESLLQLRSVVDTLRGDLKNPDGS